MTVGSLLWAPSTGPRVVNFEVTKIPRAWTDWQVLFSALATRIYDIIVPQWHHHPTSHITLFWIGWLSFRSARSAALVCCEITSLSRLAQPLNTFRTSCKQEGRKREEKRGKRKRGERESEVKKRKRKAFIFLTDFWARLGTAFYTVKPENLPKLRVCQR